MPASYCSKVSIIDLMSPGFFIGLDGESTKLSNLIITGQIYPSNFLTQLGRVKPAISIPLYAAFLDEAFCANDHTDRWDKLLKGRGLDHGPIYNQMKSKEAVERAKSCRQTSSISLETA